MCRCRKPAWPQIVNSPTGAMTTVSGGPRTRQWLVSKLQVSFHGYSMARGFNCLAYAKSATDQRKRLGRDRHGVLPRRPQPARLMRHQMPGWRISWHRFAGTTELRPKSCAFWIGVTRNWASRRSSSTRPRAQGDQGRTAWVCGTAVCKGHQLLLNMGACAREWSHQKGE